RVVAQRAAGLLQGPGSAAGGRRGAAPGPDGRRGTAAALGEHRPDVPGATAGLLDYRAGAQPGTPAGTHRAPSGGHGTDARSDRPGRSLGPSGSGTTTVAGSPRGGAGGGGTADRTAWCGGAHLP